MNRELMEFQDAKLTQKVAARYQAAASATPIFDELYRSNSKITPALSKLVDQLGAISDKVEQASKYEKTSEVLELTRKALDVAYKIFAPFRPMLSRGESEIATLKTLGGTQVAKEALQVYEEVRRDLSQKYNAVAQSLQDLNEILSGTDGFRGLERILERNKDAVEALALEVTHVKNFYAQYVRAYAGG